MHYLYLIESRFFSINFKEISLPFHISPVTKHETLPKGRLMPRLKRALKIIPLMFSNELLPITLFGYRSLVTFSTLSKIKVQIQVGVLNIEPEQSE